MPQTARFGHTAVLSSFAHISVIDHSCNITAFINEIVVFNNSNLKNKFYQIKSAAGYVGI